MQTLYRYIIVMLALLAGAVMADAQEATIKRVEAAPMDVSAAKYKRTDLNGATCALVKVQVLADGVEFTGNVVGQPEHRTGEYWVYLSPGTKMMGIQSSTFLPLMVTFPPHGIPELQPACTYIVTLDLPQPPAQQASASASFNYLVLKVSPANARVTVDGTEREVTDGVAKVVLRNGTYAYHVEAPGYLPEDGRVTVSNAKTERTVTLRSTRGSLSVSAAAPATEIYINGERKGAGAWHGELLPDTYIVEGRLEGHRPVEQIVTLTTGETATVTLPALAPITGSLNVDYLPAGATITIDGTRRGTTPDIIPDLLVGPHTVTISADGHTPATLTATVTEGQMAALTGQLLPDADVKLKRFSSYGKYGFMDASGKIVIPTKYDGAGFFSDGLALVYVNGKWGFIDKNDRMVIPAKYDEAGSFSDGLAPVTVNGKWGFIDKNDRMVIPAKYDYTGIFSEGLAQVKVNGKWGFIDKNDSMVIPAKYDVAGFFSEGLAQVKVNGKWGFIDKNDRMVIPTKYDYVWNFSDGMAKVKVNDKYGFIDRNDRMVIPAKYDDKTENFSEGLALVYVNGKAGFIDKNDRMVIPAKYDDALSFSEGLAKVKVNGKRGFIDKNDRMVIPAKYNVASNFSKGLAEVYVNGREFYVDKEGNEVVPH